MDTTLAKTNRATVLIVDDSPDTLTLLSGLLKDDYRVKIASKGEQALAIARGAPTVTAVSIPPPDLILLDVMMPGIDGYEVCRQLKADPLTQQIPVIFLTAKNDIADEEQGFALGAVDYITKPVSPPILLARVKTHLHLKATYDHLKRLLKFREDMVNMLVHDLRNPLSTIVPIVDLMLKSPDLPVERQQKMLKLMQKGGQQLQVLVEDLLLKAKLESGTLTLERQPTNLCDLCDLALETFGDSMIHKNIQLTTHYPPPPHRLMAVDASLYRRAIENLIANALKFSPPDSEVVISVTYPDTAGATVAIADRGPGVASQFREQIFEKYEIGPLWAGIPQMGLGLAFCKAIVEAHGGRIWVMDNPPRGSIFTMELPC